MRRPPSCPHGAWPFHFYPSAYRKLRWIALVLANRVRDAEPRCCVCGRQDRALILKHAREDRIWTITSWLYDLVSEREDWTYWRAVCRVCARTDNFFALSGEPEPVHTRAALGPKRARREKS